MIIVLANGCFDVLHPGHVQHLKEARSMGDKLIVSLTEDAFVNKGPHRPIHTWELRALHLRELRCVDEVIKTQSGAQAILEVEPHFFVKGSDYKIIGLQSREKQACRKVGAQIIFTRSKKMSSTDLIRRIVR